MLFAFFGLWTTLGVGVGAVSVPIIIHLLNRRRYRIVTWAAMRFLLAAQKQNSRRLRLEQLLLLLVRVGVVALVVLAMSAVTPWAENLWAAIWPDGGRPAQMAGSRVHHILVIDGSLSMNATVDSQSLFERARRLVLAKVKQAPAGDGFSVLLMKDNPNWIVGEASPNAAKVIREIEAVRPSHGNSSLPGTLNMVASKLTEASNRFPAQMVYFFTDLQLATWAGMPPIDSGKDGADQKTKNPWDEIQQRARTVFVDVGRDDTDNLAVTDLSIDEPFITTGMKAPLNAMLQNFGKDAKQNVRVELLVGKAREAGNEPPLSPRVVAQELVNLRAAEPLPIAFEYKFPEPGVYAVQVRIEHKDDVLELDNVRSAIVTVKDTIPVLLVNGKPSVDKFDRATEYLRLALNPFPRGSEPKWAPLRPKVVNANNFADVPEEELQSYDLIALCDVGQFGAGDLRRLDAHVRRGGGLLVALGEKAMDNLESYNRLFFKGDQSLLPAQLFRKVSAPAEHYFTLHAQENQFLELPLRAFKNDDDRVSLKSGRFRNYIEVKAADDAKVRTILTFMPELAIGAAIEFDKKLSTTDPAMLEWNPPLGKLELGKGKHKGQWLPAARYRGKVVLFTSTVNMDWNTWPGSPSFGAVMQETARLAVSGRLREHAAPVGALLEEFLPSTGAELDVAVNFPPAVPAIKPGRTRTQLVEEVNVFRWTDTDLSGLYRVVIGNGPQELPFAVNVPATTTDQRGRESDLARVDKVKLQELFPGWEFQIVLDARDAQVGGGPINPDAITVREPIGPDIAHWILLLALILVFAEVILAWRFGHYSAVHGSGSEPVTGLVMPSFVAVIALALFALLAVVLGHALLTGDFLGFLPRILRNWFERLVGAPPTPPGEESRWELGGRAVFFDGFHDAWYLGLLGVGGLALVFFMYRAEGPNVNKIYKLLMGGLRVFMIWLMLGILLPQRDWRIDRQGWPDLVVLIDTSRSMGEPDHYNNDKLRDRAKQLGELIQKSVKERLPERIKAIKDDLEAKRPLADNQAEAKAEVEELQRGVKELERQLELLNSPGWRPTRLQLVQALLAHQPELDWLKTIVSKRRMKVHLFELDSQGRAIKLADQDGAAGEITEQDPKMIERAHRAVADLQTEGKESRLGTALRQVIDQYRGASLAAVVMFTDGVTTRDESIGQVSEYAAQKAVPLHLIGIGDDHEIRDLKLHDLVVDDTVFVNDKVVFDARLTGKGYKKDFAVPVVLKVKDKNGKERELTRTTVKINPQGKAERFKLVDQPKEPGRKQFIIEVETPKTTPNEKPPPAANLRLERTIEVMDAKVIKILYIEGQPRYEFRYIKFLLEREAPDAKKNKVFDLKTFLVDADPDFAQTDRTALVEFPRTQAELGQYDVVILGDVDPRSPKIGEQNLRNLADFVRGEDSKGKKFGKGGGGLLLMAGALYNPHSYKDTPLAEVIPIEPGPKPPEAAVFDKKLRLELTPMGRMHPIFRFNSDDAQNMQIFQRLAPMYWWSHGYRLKPLAEVLAVHPDLKGDPRDPAGQDGRLPLVVQQFVGAGRSVYFGFDETWRWRFRDDEPQFNNFWIQTMRYLARTRPTRTDLRLDRQTPYRLGEPIKITVRFPDSTPIPGVTDGKAGPKTEVKVVMEYRPPTKQDAQPEPEVQSIQLAKLEGSWGTFEHTLSRTREGKYRFWLMSPDVSRLQSDGEKPSAEASVELPPGELDRLRMNEYELSLAAEATQGRFYTILDANDFLDELQTGQRISLGGGGGGGGGSGEGPGVGGNSEIRPSLGSPMPAIKLWNQWWIFAIVMFLLTSEWVLRKRKHML